MTRKQIFDANVWIGFFASNDPHHRKASALFEKLNDDDIIYTTTEIITEIITVLNMRYDVTAAQTFVKFFLHTPNVIRIPSGLYFDTTLNYFLTLKATKLSFADLTLVLLSQQFQVHTFDKVLAKQLKT